MSLGQGDQVELHTAQIFREDSVTLYGFETTDELEMFQLLGTVNGVGPKSALAIIGQLGVSGLQQAVTSADDSMFRSVSGIGPKTAKLIVLSLSGKLVLGEQAAASSDSNVLAALTNLGYQEKVARAALQIIQSEHNELSEGELLKLVLAHLSPAKKA
jgi:Holliday junction DNA helicase RuvA